VRALPALPPGRGPRLTASGTPRTALDAAVAVAERAERVRARIEAAARRAGRDPSSVTLVAASKQQPPERVRAAFDAGVRVFGESRVQEALPKIRMLPSEIEWHFIGPLQTNKVRQVAAVFAVLHSVDRLRLATALDAEGARIGRDVTCFLEINLAGEPTKHGFQEDELIAALPALRELVHLRPVGVMAIPPPAAEAGQSRPWFRALARLRDRIAGAPGWTDFPGLLSMGMSDDFEVAIEEGATHVRVGSALFGSRPPTRHDAD
jgi:pyridoxal phosphate enzyme (YggS family)